MGLVDMNGGIGLAFAHLAFWDFLDVFFFWNHGGHLLVCFADITRAWRGVVRKRMPFEI